MRRRFPFFLRTVEDPAGKPVSVSRELVFHHLPKTAGSTFRRLLESLFDPDEVCPAEIDDEVRALSADERDRYRLYAGHFSWGLLPEQFPDAIWLTFLRHPVERVVSEYYNVTTPEREKAKWRQRIAERPGVRKFLDRVAGMSLDEYIRLDEPRARDRLINRQTRYLADCGIHQMKAEGAELFYFPVNEPDLLERAKTNLCDRFAFVGIQEYFDLSLGLFALIFGLRSFGDLGAFTDNLNPLKSAGRHYDLSDDVLEFIHEHNPMDIELWEYGKSLLFERLRMFTDYLMCEDSWLRRHPDYRNVRRSPLHLLRRSITQSVEEVTWRRGFHRVERDGLDRPFCWSGYEDPAIIEIDFDVPDRSRIQVDVVTLNAIDDNARRDLRITFDNAPLEQPSVTESDGRIIHRGVVRTDKPAWPRRHHAIKLHGPRSLEPEGVEHRRLLGVAVHAVELKIR